MCTCLCGESLHESIYPSSSSFSISKCQDTGEFLPIFSIICSDTVSLANAEHELEVVTERDAEGVITDGGHQGGLSRDVRAGLLSYSTGRLARKLDRADGPLSSATCVD